MCSHRETTEKVSIMFCIINEKRSNRTSCNPYELHSHDITGGIHIEACLKRILRGLVGIDIKPGCMFIN